MLVRRGHRPGHREAEPVEASAASGQSAAAETSDSRKRGLAPSIRTTRRRSLRRCSGTEDAAFRRLRAQRLGEGSDAEGGAIRGPATSPSSSQAEITKSMASSSIKDSPRRPTRCRTQGVSLSGFMSPA